MELSDSHIEEFKKLHQKYGGLNNYSEEQIREIANGLANYYLTLFEIYQRIKKDEKNTDPHERSKAL
jgi:hypothetical protein